MNKVLVILRKEFLEIAQQRILLYSILLPPLLFIVIPFIFLQRGGNGSRASALKVPSLQGLTVHEYTQGLVGTEFSNIYILLSMIVPSVIAAYSIIGEKSNHTLEPLLATPVRRWQLLAGKMLSALLPAVLVTWISGGLFIAELAILTDANVVSHVVTAGWVTLFIPSTPRFRLIPGVLLTGHFFPGDRNPTSAQVSIMAAVPILGLILGELSGQFELTALVAVIATVVLIPPAVLFTLGAAQMVHAET